MDKSPFNVPTLTIVDDGGSDSIAVSKPTGNGTGPAGDAAKHSKMVILGSGPAGLTAAIYAARANLEPLLIGGYAPGGQLMITSDVENYPGFPEGIQGPELMQKFREQAERFGTRFVDVDVESVDLSARPFRLWAEGTEYTADSVVVATGASALWLGLDNETRLRGRGERA
jgi:thioredoxin reductase (NADPH)